MDITTATLPARTVIHLWNNLAALQGPAAWQSQVTSYANPGAVVITGVVVLLSALGLLAFLGAHLWLAFIRPRFVYGHAEPFQDIAHEMRFHGPTLVVYVLGTLAVSYHLANGLQTFAFGWGAATSRRALNGKVLLLSWIAFVALLAMSWGAIDALWSAGALV